MIYQKKSYINIHKRNLKQIPYHITVNLKTKNFMNKIKRQTHAKNNIIFLSLLFYFLINFENISFQQKTSAVKKSFKPFS